MADEDHSFSQSQGGSQQSFPESQKTYISSTRSHHSSSQSLPLPGSSQNAMNDSKGSAVPLVFPPPPPPLFGTTPSLSRQLRSLPSGFHRLPIELHRRIIKLALSPPDLNMPMASLNAKEAETLLRTCKMFNTLCIPLVHSRVLLRSSATASQYLETVRQNPVLATYVRRLELQGQDWQVETVLEVLRLVGGPMGLVSNGRTGTTWLAMSLMDLTVRRESLLELEEVLARMQGLRSFEWYCPGFDLQSISLPRILNAWSGSLESVGLSVHLLPPPLITVALLHSLTSLPSLTHLYLNAGLPSFPLPTTGLIPPPLDHTNPHLPILSFYLHLLDHAKTHGIRVLLYLAQLGEEFLVLLASDPRLCQLLTVTDATDNRLFGHVFEDMDDPVWRDRVSCKRWRELMAVPLPVVLALPPPAPPPSL